MNGGDKSLQSVLPLAKEFGAAVIGLCISDDGIPANAQDRVAVAGKIIERAGKIGLPIEDVVIDPLAMAMGADHNSGRITLETISLVQEKFGVNITMGASNISFGLPDRKYINSTFLAMAIHAGLTCPITNPLVSEVRKAIQAADLALGRDEYAINWISEFRKNL